MKNFDSRAYSINDFVEWNKNKQLELSPKFQRRNVWSDNARSYLMDTIIRGKPIPKFFIRQKLNPTTKASTREVVDGQQRLRTILLFLDDGFQISKKHNDKYGGLFFSQLAQVDDEVQANILNYELAVDLLVNMPDAEILDIFGRLNSYAITLNQQEKINADHFGPFKLLADDLGHRYHEFWTSNKILTDNAILRMAEVTLTADLLIAMLEGMKAKKKIQSFYNLYEKNYPYNIETPSKEFDAVIKIISGVFPDTLKTSELRRIHLFYSLFTAVYHMNYGIPGCSFPRKTITPANYAKVRGALDSIDSIFDPTSNQLGPLEKQFLEDSRRATTDEPVRVRRTKYIVNILNNAL
ncbi:DUF262 domain-containing protein [Myxococcus fulvus]|nr:DUF262 domain-containing protein [Myxococcus fulvus]